MTQEPRKLPPAGWYPDPRTKGQERYWTGADWTQDVRAPQPRPLGVPADWETTRPRPAPQPTYPPPGGHRVRPGELDPFQPIGLGQRVQPAPAGATAPQRRRPASFGARLAATVLDYVLVQLVTVLLGIPIWLRNAPLAREIAAELEKPRPDVGALTELAGRIPLADQMMVFGLLFGVWFVYGGLMLQFVGATVGHLALGLRTVPAEDECAKLSASRAWGRAFGWSLLWTAGNITFLAPLLVVACLRMLWSPTRQTLVDALCRTKVVRRR